MPNIPRPVLEEMAKAICEHVDGHFNQSYINQVQSALQVLDRHGLCVVKKECSQEMANAGLLALATEISKHCGKLEKSEKYKNDPESIQGIRNFEAGAMTRNSGECKVVWDAMINSYENEQDGGDGE